MGALKKENLNFHLPPKEGELGKWEGQSYLADGSVGHLCCGQLPVGHRHSGKTRPQGLVLQVDETLQSPTCFLGNSALLYAGWKCLLN